MFAPLTENRKYWIFHFILFLEILIKIPPEIRKSGGVLLLKISVEKISVIRPVGRHHSYRHVAVCSVFVNALYLTVFGPA